MLSENDFQAGKNILIPFFDVVDAHSTFAFAKKKINLNALKTLMWTKFQLKTTAVH